VPVGVVGMDSLCTACCDCLSHCEPQCCTSWVSCCYTWCLCDPTDRTAPSAGAASLLKEDSEKKPLASVVPPMVSMPSLVSTSSMQDVPI
jgi:hypothetical protein